MNVKKEIQSSSAARARANLNRRQFCNALAITSAAMAIAAQSVTAEAETTGQSQTLAYPPQKIEGAERLLPGSSLYFTYPSSSDPAILVRWYDGQYYAYSQKCTHLGCSIYFDAARRCLECPCHKGAYNLQSGDVMYGPPQRPLDLINLQMRAGGVLWAIGKTIGSREQYARS